MAQLKQRIQSLICILITISAGAARGLVLALAPTLLSWQRICFCALSNFGLRVLRTPVQSPKANAYCERLIGTIRRECLGHMIPLCEKHLRKILREWVAHYNRGRPHASLGHGIPESVQKPVVRLRKHRHELPAACRIRVKDVLAGLHHEYSLESEAA
jgi:transposase InsO family protein